MFIGMLKLNFITHYVLHCTILQLKKHLVWEMKEQPATSGELVYISKREHTSIYGSLAHSWDFIRHVSLGTDPPW